MVEQKYRNVQQRSKLLLLSDQKPRECSALHEVIATMKSDDITIIARNDDQIMKYDALLAEKVGREWHHEVSQRTRQLSRLLCDLRGNSTETPAMTLQDYKKPELFEWMITSVRKLCSFEELGKTKAVGTPSQALKLGYAIKNVLPS